MCLHVPAPKAAASTSDPVVTVVDTRASRAAARKAAKAEMNLLVGKKNLLARKQMTANAAAAKRKHTRIYELSKKACCSSKVAPKAATIPAAFNLGCARPKKASVVVAVTPISKTVAAGTTAGTHSEARAEVRAVRKARASAIPVKAVTPKRVTCNFTPASNIEARAAKRAAKREALAALDLNAAEPPVLAKRLGAPQNLVALELARAAKAEELEHLAHERAAALLRRAALDKSSFLLNSVAPRVKARCAARTLGGRAAYGAALVAAARVAAQ